MSELMKAKKEEVQGRREIRVRYVQIWFMLGVHFSEHRLVWRDLEEAWGAVSLFFGVWRRVKWMDLERGRGRWLSCGVDSGQCEYGGGDGRGRVRA